MTGFNTRAIHAGQEPDPLTGAVTVPDLPDLDLQAGRRRRPARRLRVQPQRQPDPDRAGGGARRARGDGARGLAFASGLAAEDTLLRTVCRPGDHVVLPDDAYGGTFRLIARVLDRWGLEHTPVPTRRPRRGARGGPADAPG